MLLRICFASPVGNWCCQQTDRKERLGAAFGVVKSAMAWGIQRLRREYGPESPMHCIGFLEHKQGDRFYSSSSGVSARFGKNWQRSLSSLDYYYVKKNLHQDKLECLGFPGATGLRTFLPMQKAQEIQVRSLGQEDLLEKEMTAHSSILAWKSPWTEDPSGPQYQQLQNAGHDWVAEHTHKLDCTVITHTVSILVA